MFNNTDTPNPRVKKRNDLQEDDELEEYLKQRNATLGEETKSLKDLQEDKAMAEYMRLRSQAYGKDSIEESNSRKIIKTEEEDLDSYLKARSETLNEELIPEEEEDQELQAYLRERRAILDE